MNLRYACARKAHGIMPRKANQPHACSYCPMCCMYVLFAVCPFASFITAGTANQGAWWLLGPSGLAVRSDSPVFVFTLRPSWRLGSPVSRVPSGPPGNSPDPLLCPPVPLVSLGSPVCPPVHLVSLSIPPRVLRCSWCLLCPAARSSQATV